MQPRDLRKLVKTLASLGVTEFHLGDMYIKFGPTPKAPVVQKKEPGLESSITHQLLAHVYPEQVDAAVKAQPSEEAPLPIPAEEEPLTPDEANRQFDLKTDRKRNRHYYQNPALWVGGKTPQFPAKGSLLKETP